MRKNEAIKMLEETKGTPCLSRNFISWLYQNDYLIVSPIERFDMNNRKLATILEMINHDRP